MTHADVLVVGGGLAGLLAAFFAAKAGKRTRLLTRGAGALAVGGGTLDLLGYLPDGTPVDRPFALGEGTAFDRLPPEHPYRLAGEEQIRAALAAFAALCAEEGFPLSQPHDCGHEASHTTVHTTAQASSLAPAHTRSQAGAQTRSQNASPSLSSSLSLPTTQNASQTKAPAGSQGADRNAWLVTAIGSLKPSWLLPPGLCAPRFSDLDELLVVGVEGLKDLVPELVIHGLRALGSLRPDIAATRMTALHLPSPFAAGGHVRDLSTLDLARWLDLPEGQNWFVENLSRCLTALPSQRRRLALVPPILGLRPDPGLPAALAARLGLDLGELITAPPAITGLRLRGVLLRALKRLGVIVQEQALVVRAVPADDNPAHCTALVTGTAGREQVHHARAVILATGGIYGGGLEVGPELVRECVADLPITASPQDADWSAPRAYAASAAQAPMQHGFAHAGVRVNQHFQPLDAEGVCVYDNIFCAGRLLRGYDPATEKSGNGVALVSAYAAARHACEVA